MSNITLKIFEKNLAIYGSDFNRWQGFDVSALRDFMANNEHALALYLSAQQIDAQLDDFLTPELNMDVVFAAKAEIIRDMSTPCTSRKYHWMKAESIKHLFGRLFGFWHIKNKPAFAFSSFVGAIIIGVIISFSALQGQDVPRAEAVDLISALNEIETLAAQHEVQNDLIVAFAEIEKEQEINQFMDYIILEFDDVLMEDAIEYLNQEG